MKNRLLSALLLILCTYSLQAQNGTPSVQMWGTATCGCDGCFIVEVSNLQPPYQFIWSNGMTGAADQASTVVCGFCPGSYTVTVTNNSANQQTVTATGFIEPDFVSVDIIVVNPAPCANDSLPSSNTCDRVCAGGSSTYSVSNFTGGFVNWTVSGAISWQAVQPGGNTINVIWGSPGAGSVRATTIGGSQGCFAEATQCVTIISPPTAQIASNPTASTGSVLQICKGQTVDFQNLSTGDADFFEWIFSDDFSSTVSSDPKHTFLNPGTHTVTLIARSNCLCSDTTSMTVEVLDATAPTLDCVATICPGETVSYSASNACAPFNWSVSTNGVILEGGTATADSITVQWGDGPNGVISLTANACSGATCPIAGVTHIPIISDNAEIRGEARVCPGSTEVYSIEPFGGTGFTWTLSGGGTIKEGQGTNHLTIDWGNFVSTSATYWLSVKYDNCYLGCSGQDSIPIKILSSFIINGPVEACVNTNTSLASRFVNNNQPIASNWTLIGPSGNTVWTSSAPINTVSVPFNDGDGYYRVFATANVPGNTCTDQAEWAIHVKPRPAKLTGIKGTRLICPGNTYTYEAEGGGPQSNYSWTVQNGASGPFIFSGKNLNVTWNASGPRWLSVAQVSNDGLTCLSDTILIQVSALVSPDITGVPSVCEDSKGFYSIAPLENVDLKWQINPATAGSVASGQGTEAAGVYWSQSGTHQVEMQVCGFTAVFPVTVFATPDPVVQAPNGLCPGATGLVQTSTPYASYAWKDNAGAILSTAASANLAADNYAVEVTDVNGCVGSKEFFIDSWDTPDVTLTTASPTGFCNNSLFVPLTALINADGNYTFQWFQDGVLIPGQTATTYSTNQYGNYTVQATNTHGCTNVAGPIRLFEYCGGGGGGCLPCNGVACPPGTVDLAIDPTARCDSFQMHLLDPNGVYQSGTAQWIVGVSGGLQLGFSTDDNPSFTFGNAGEYVAILVVQLTNGTVCNVFDFFGAEAVARIDAVPACPGDSTQFKDISEFLPSGGISSWDWTFGDPASGAENQSGIRNPGHVFSPNGAYTATLTVTGTSGCTSTASHVVAIPELPDLTFPEPSFKCAGNALEFVPPPNAATITEITWDFGDPASGASNDATGTPSYHGFSPAGNYTVTATAKNIYGCTNTYSRSINIAPNNLSGTITPPVPPAICEGGSITLGAPAGAVSYVWSDEIASTTPFLTVTQEGVFQVTVTDANGCTYAPPAVKVEQNPTPDVVIKGLLFNELNQIIGTSYPTQTICAGEDIVLQAVTNGSFNYSWTVANGNNSFLYYTDDRNNLLAPGNYNYAVTVTNPVTGCSTVSTPFSVTVHTVPSGFSINGSGFCAGAPTTLSYNGPQPPNWQLIWNTGLNGPNLTTENSGVYQIRVVNEFGCEAQSNQYTILPGPRIDAVPAGCHTRCNPDTICMPNLPDVVQYQWYQNGVLIPGATSPSYIATQSGAYWAVLTDWWGCSAQSDPLTLDLYDGYGKILGQVWSDVNNNGIIDAGDTLVSSIPVNLYQNGTLFDAASSGVLGNFAFPNILSTNYSVQLDPLGLPADWEVVIGQAPVNLSGCDVVGQADLLIRLNCPVAVGTLQLATCAGDSVTYQGVSIPAGASQTFQYTAANGCDSLLTVQVASWPTASSVALLRACPGGFATYAGTNIPTGSFQIFTLQTWHGCDSIVEVYVAPWPTSSGSATLYACPGGTAAYAGANIPVGATQAFTLQNWHGCDSIVTINVQPWPTSTSQLTLNACMGDSVNFAGTNIPAGGVQSFTFPNWLGCDSTVTVTVQPWPASTGSATLLFACAGGSAVFNGVNVPAGTTQQFTLQTWHGCDSIVTVNVATLPPATGATTLFACPGGSATYAGATIPVGTSQQFTMPNWLGCDSIVTVSVAPWPVSTGSATLFACPGGSASYAGTAIPVGATQQFTLPNWLGCDSIVTVNVAVWPTSTGAATLYACPGGSAMYAGASIPAGTSQQFILPNWLGCDSIVTISVAPWATINSSFEVGVCPGETFVYQGVTLNGGMVQPFVLPNWLGCDSTVTVIVKQLQQSTNMLQASICPGEIYIFEGERIPAGNSRDFHFTNAEGCDSTLTVQVSELPTASFEVHGERACAQSPTGSLEVVTNPGGQPPFQYSLNALDYQNDTHFNSLSAGSYQVFLEDANGCVFAQNATIPLIPAIQLQLPNGILPCDSNAVTLTPIMSGGDTATLGLTWWNGATQNATLATEAGPVWVEATDICGTARSEAMVAWAELADDLEIVYVPNVLKPAASDPENAQFRPLFASGIEVLSMKFMVFDRWGNELFETSNMNDAWDALFGGEKMNPGVQVWYLEADVAICGRVIHVEKKGDVTVVR